MTKSILYDKMIEYNAKYSVERFMKNKILLVLLAILTTLFILTLTVSASEACLHEGKNVTSVEYADYTKDGVMKLTCPSCDATQITISPLLKHNGYSISNDGTGICTGYTVNSDALDEIKKLNNRFEIGMVAASKALLGNKMPLDSKTATAVDLSQYGAQVVKAQLSAENCSLVDLRLDGFSDSVAFEQLYLTAYAFDGNQVKYVQGATKDTISKVSLHTVQNQADIKIGDVTFSLYEPSSTIAFDRQKQTNLSKADFNIGTSKTDDELQAIINDTGLITNVLTSAFYPSASAFMKHYLNASGADYTINMGSSTFSSGFFKSSYTKEHRNTRITQAMRACEQLAVLGEKIDVYQKGEIVNAFPNTDSAKMDDIRLSVGSYFTCINMLNVTVTENANGTKTYSADVVYNVADFYNWDANDPYDQIKGMLPSPQKLHELHRAGLAQEFTAKGTATYSITWTEGQSYSDVD